MKQKQPVLILIVLSVLLGFLHQDYWLWGNQSLIAGFLPIGLAYHVVFNLLSSALWAFAVFKCWPEELEDSVEAKIGEGISE